MSTKTKILTALLALSAVVTTSCSQKYNYDLTEYITLAEYKGVEVSAAELDEQLQEEIDELIEDNTTETEITDRAAQTGDIVNIDYKGYKDGELYTQDDQTLEDTDLEITIGEGLLTDDLENSIIGKETGTTYTTDVTFPEDYEAYEQLQGVTLQFEVTINSISEETIPEFDDAFVAENTDYETVEEYKEETRKSLYENFVWNTIVDNTTVLQYPKKEVKEYYDNTLSSYKSYASYYGVTLDSFVSSYMGTDIDSFLDEIADYAKLQAKNEMCIRLIAQNESITVTDEEYDARVAEYVEDYDAEDQAALEESYTKDTIKEAMLYDMVLEFAVANAVDVD